jgi:ZIP family zinc transporter
MDMTKIWVPLLLSFLAGIFTVASSIITFFIRDLKRGYLHFSLGLSAGVMVYISFVELLASAIKSIGVIKANLAFFGGIILFMFIDFIIPHQYIEERIKINGRGRRLMKTGILITLGIAIHNFPEGLAVFMSYLVSVKLSLVLALAKALHNIPEGLAVAIPIFYATKSRWKAFWYSFLSGFAEPVGAIIGLLILMPFITTSFLYLSLAFVAGIMVFISFDELLPLSCESGSYHLAISGIIIGMVIMALSTAIL